MTTEAATWTHKIAPGWDNTAGYARIVDLVGAGGVVFTDHFVHTMGSYSPGELVVNGDLSVVAEGMASLTLTMDVSTPGQYRHLLTYLNISGGIWSGKVTVYAPTTDEHDYLDYNAILTIPPPVAVRYEAGWWRRLTLTFNDLREIV